MDDTEVYEETELWILDAVGPLDSEEVWQFVNGRVGDIDQHRRVWRILKNSPLTRRTKRNGRVFWGRSNNYRGYLVVRAWDVSYRCWHDVNTDRIILTDVDSGVVLKLTWAEARLLLDAAEDLLEDYPDREQRNRKSVDTDTKSDELDEVLT